MDCDSNTLKPLPQILTEKKGGSLDARKCFLFLRFHGFDVPHVTLKNPFGTLGKFLFNEIDIAIWDEWLVKGSLIVRSVKLLGLRITV